MYIKITFFFIFVGDFEWCNTDWTRVKVENWNPCESH